MIPMNTPTIIFFEKKWILRYFLRFPVTPEYQNNDAIITHILISDRTFFYKKSMWQYLLDQTHMWVKGICLKVPSDGVIVDQSRNA